MLRMEEQNTDAPACGCVGEEAAARSTILVVEDDRELRELYSEILADEGYAVVEAANGAEALDRLRQGVRPALIVLDVRMPVMDGATFCRIWRAHEDLPQPPLVIVSAERDLRPVSDVCRSSAVLQKPLELEELRALAARFVH